jgi:hypothetical protein
MVVEISEWPEYYGDHVHLGKITRIGSSPLRIASVEAAITAARKSAEYPC